MLLKIELCISDMQTEFSVDIASCWIMIWCLIENVTFNFTASRGGYEPTTVPTTLGREAFPLHMRRQEELFSYGYTVYSW
jgi:hypothetical protein